MSKLSALRKQISALEAKAERLTKLEMASSIAKVKAMMHSLGVTVEHLGSNVSTAVKNMTGGKPAASKKTRTKSSGVGVAKYADPKSGQTWSGFGRAPAWIASAKDRTVFLVYKAEATGAVAPVSNRTKAAKIDKSATTAKKATKKAATKTKAVSKKVARGAKASVTAPAKAAASAKKQAVKTVARKAPPTKAATAKLEATRAPTAE